VASRFNIPGGTKSQDIGCKVDWKNGVRRKQVFVSKFIAAGRFFLTSKARPRHGPQFAHHFFMKLLPLLSLGCCALFIQMMPAKERFLVLRV
jgi:hypothetical protein